METPYILNGSFYKIIRKCDNKVVSQCQYCPCQIVQGTVTSTGNFIRHLKRCPMAWMMANPQIYNTFSSLGVLHGDVYIVNDDCLGILEEILRNLIIEDRTLRTYRRAIGFGENIRRDLIPLLIHVKNSTKIKDATKIIDVTVKILLNLTIPVECLLSLEQESRTDVGRHTIFELNRLLVTSKAAFTDSRSTKAVVDHMKYVVEKDSALNVEQCDSINNCLLLLRNILHIPEHRPPISNCPLAHSSLQNQIIWNLFTQSIDKIMIHLMSCPQKLCWGVAMVQLIALMYKDQYVGTLQKLLSLWFEASLSESSEDNESNTSPQNQGSGESSPTLTSDPTSDSSDNGGSGNGKTDRSKNNVNNSADNVCNRAAEVVRAAQNRTKVVIGITRGESTETDISTNSGGSQSIDSGFSSKAESLQTEITSICGKTELLLSSGIQQEATPKPPRKYICKSSQSEFSDCGYVTLLENRGECISTSSNDGDQPHQKPIHQKPFQKIRYSNLKNRTVTTLEKKELRRKKLVKRSKTNIINMKGLMHHMPTDEDITNVLKEFTVDFLLKSYGTLVHNLYSQLLTNVHLQIMDTSHFFWLVTYFLKFAAPLELDLELISPVISYDIISYLVFQGVWLHEELEIGCQFMDTDIKPSLRRLHLIVTAIREFLQALETHQKITHLSEDDRNNLLNLELQISEMEELRNLFILLLRQYNPNLHSKQYLQDLIVTNHSYLLLLDKISKNGHLKLNIMDHLKAFATSEIMCQYGILLEEFKENGEFVNNCIFTMMHHTAGDLGNIATLFLPNILKTFSQIWETDYDICDDWSDLIEYTIHRFIKISKSNQQIYSILRSATPVLNDDIGNLSTPGVASQISVENEWTQEEKYPQIGFPGMPQDMENTISSVIRNYDENFTNKNQNKLMKEILEQNIINDESMITSNSQKENIRIGSPTLDHENSVNGDIKVLKEHLIKEKKQKMILWLQKSLLDACYAKLMLTNPDIHCKNNIVPPITYYYTLLNLPIPLVPWISEQCSIVKHQPFVLLLHKLGFILPGDVGKIFIRIPNFWNADYLLNVAEQLGPIDTEKVKSELHLLLVAETTSVKLENNKQNSGFINNCGFLTMTSKQAPSMVRYTPRPNSMEWLSTVLPTKVAPLMDSTLNILNKNQLSIDIPEIEMISAADVPLPELSLVQSLQGTNSMHIQEIEMDCFALQEVDIIEQNSICESVESDLTRMYVSDEEEKMIVLAEKV